MPRGNALQAAVAHHASRVLAITHDDAVNTQIVATVRELAVHRSRQLRKESSRDQAREIPIHLRKVGCAIAPLRDWDAKDFTFTDPEIRMLAIAEHQR